MHRQNNKSLYDVLLRLCISTSVSFQINCTAKMATANDKNLTLSSRVTLSDNNRMPRLGALESRIFVEFSSFPRTLGLGTWQSESGQVQNIVREAILNANYRQIDGAWIYGNENEVGNGVHEAIEQSQGKIKREDLFITTKLWNQVKPFEQYPALELLFLLASCTRRCWMGVTG